MNNVYKNKANTLIKVALYISIGAIMIQGLIKLIFGVGWYDIEINAKLSEFYLFKIDIIQTILMQILLMFNFVIIIAIANNATIKSVICKTWYLLMWTYLLNYLSDYTFIVQIAICLTLNCVYNYNGKFKDVVKTSLIAMVVMVCMAMYQIIIMVIRYGLVQDTNYIFNFYEQLTLIVNMYILTYLVYRVRGQKHG